MRDYMVTELGQFEHFDKLLLRNASIKELIKDATDRLLQLQKQAQDLLTDLDVGGPAREEILQTNSLRREKAALKALMVVRDAEFMNLRTENQLLEQSLEGFKTILQEEKVERREQARQTTETQQRSDGLKEERTVIRELNKEFARTKHILYRVEAERDRLGETENPHQARGQSRQDPTNTRRPQKPAAAEGGIPAPTGIDKNIGGKKGLPASRGQEKPEVAAL